MNDPNRETEPLPVEPHRQIELDEVLNVASDPDQAWKSLNLVNDWIRHADAKVGATLAVSGVSAAMLYNLVRGQHNPGFLLSSAAVIAGVATGLAGGSAALALMPRLALETKFTQWRSCRDVAMEELGPRDDPVNLLFFSNVAKQYDGDAPSYIELLCALTADREKLTRQIAHQVHANATVAHRKFIWADRAIRLIVIALLVLAIVAVMIGAKN